MFVATLRVLLLIALTSYALHATAYPTGAASCVEPSHYPATTTR
jgi:hypothetical protein